VTAEPRMLTISQVAKKLPHMSKDTVRRACANGKLPGAERTFGGHWRIPASTVETLAKARKTS
jgi:excisionase family DNA binding protein